MMNKAICLSILLLISFLFFSCDNNQPTTPEPPVKLKPPGVFVVNEGNFTFGNSSLTYYNKETNYVISDVFYMANQVPLGDVANFIALNGNSAYIVVNNSGVIYKVDISTAIFQNKVAGLISPRELLFLNNKIIVTDIVDPYLSVVDVQSMTVESKINLDGYTSESIVSANGKIYVNSWSAMYQEKRNDRILVIDANTLKLTDSIKVTLEPNSMAVDKNNNLWVLCSGGYMHEEKAALIKINTGTDIVEKNFVFENNSDYPTDLEINGQGDVLFFINKDIYRMNISDDKLPDSSFIKSDDKTFYALGIDPVTSDIYVSDALNYTQNGKVYIYNQEGALQNDFAAGISPGCFAFNR